MARLVFITHPEVVIDPTVPVPRWPLSDRGRARMAAFLTHPAIAEIRAIACSDERKARDGAEILARRAGVPIPADGELGENDRSPFRTQTQTLADAEAAPNEHAAPRARIPILVDPELGENDRSATGYIAPPEFWEVVEAFFARPEESIRGWERAADAQARIVRAVSRVAREAPEGDVAIVSHGGVGSLLLAHLQGARNARPFAQPHGGGGCYFVIDRERITLLEGWRIIDEREPGA